MIDFYLTLNENYFGIIVFGIVFLALTWLISFMRDKRYPMNYTEEQIMLRKCRSKYDGLLEILDIVFILVAMMYCTASKVCTLLEAGLIVLP